MNSDVRVIESDSCWERFRVRFLKPAYVIATVILILVLSIIVAVILILTSDYDTSDKSEPVDYSRALIVSDERDLWAVDLKDNNKRLLTRTSRGISAFDLYSKNTIFWYETGSQWVNSLSKKYPNLTQAREWQPKAIAVDFVTENIYVLDALSGTLNIHSMTRKNYSIALSDLEDPDDMALDPTRGLIFIVQKSHSIIRCSMDGSSITRIITNTCATSVALDMQTSKLYWNDFEKIMSSNYDGSDQSIVVRACKSTSLGVSGLRLFWTLPPNDSNIRTLWSCTMTTSGVCEDADVHQLPFEDPKAIKVYAENLPQVDNTCKHDNGDCQHLCLLTSTISGSIGRSCACFVGYRLKEDSKSCELASEYLLYVRGNFVRGRLLGENLDKESFTDAIEPIHLNHTAKLRDKYTVDLDLSVYNGGSLVYSDDELIGSVKLYEGSESVLQNSEKCLKQVSYDWATGDVYYIRGSCPGVGSVPSSSAILVLRAEGSRRYRKTLHTFQASQGQPTSLAVHPNSGLYFFTVLHTDGIARIYRTHGLKMTVYSTSLGDDSDANANCLAMDHEESRLYWLSRNGSLLYSADLAGNDLRSVVVSVVIGPRCVSLYDRYAYVANLSSVWRIDKLTGRGAKRLVPATGDGGLEERMDLAGARIFSPRLQSVEMRNPCAVENGGCRQFCFREPRVVVTGPNSVNVTNELQKVCLCEDHQIIETDGRTCRSMGSM